MRKSLAFLGIILLSVFIFTLSLSHFVSSSMVFDVDEKVASLEKTMDTIDSLQDEDVRTAYLKEEWPKILNNSKTYLFAKSVYEKNSNWVDPLSSFFVGMSPIMNLIYILAFFLFLYSLVLFQGYSYFTYLLVPTKFQKISKRGIFFILFIFSSILSLPALFSFAIFKTYYGLETTFSKVFFWVLIFIIFYTLDLFANYLRKIAIAKGVQKGIEESKKMAERAKKEAKKSKDESEQKKGEEDSIEDKKDMAYGKAYFKEAGKVLRESLEED